MSANPHTGASATVTQPKQEAQATQPPTAVARGDLKWLHFFVNPNKKHAVGYVVAVTVAAVAGFFFQEGLKILKTKMFGDPQAQKLDQIQSSSNAIKSAVDELKATLNSTEPLDAQAVMAKLDLIAQQNTQLLPLAQGLANATSGYVRGAKIKNGPFDEVGSFYMDLNNGQSGGMAHLCDNATLTYSQGHKRFRLDHKGRTDTRYLNNPGALRLNNISVVVHSAFDNNGSLQVTYDCNLK